jgi:radical SAM-linked protein
MLEDFLPLVAKPARYINTEVHSVHKDLSKIRTKVCLFFPDAYEVGMSHLGLRILYHILNNRDDTACERVFSPWTDYEQRLRASGRPLTSLESNLPLSQFDIIGITLQYELSYTNIIAGLGLAQIPLLSSDRTDSHPVVIAGGPCAVNPEPLADFIDAFFIGEAEEAIHEIVELRQEYPTREKYLIALAQREGFYVPALGKRAVRRRFVRDLESAAYPNRPILPLMKPVHDRATVEIARGCIRGCRFCQAGIIYRPYRERSAERVKALLHESLSCTGYDELSLASLSSGDYSVIQPLMQDLVNRYRESRISISLPSLRIGTLTPDMIRAIAGVRKTGFTLAPEAGTERLRRVINKAVTDTDLMDAAETIFASGWNVLKLYFMIGLPTETDADLDGIIRIAHNLLALGKKASKRHVQLNISVSTFVPKPHTPFQWFGQATREDIRVKHAYLENGLRRKGISMKPHNPEMSMLEGSFARGDRNIGKVIGEAVRRGCRFDGWTECFSFTTWQEAFQACGLEPTSYACRAFELDDELPWDHIKSGVTTEFLKREYRRAVTAEITGNCRVECERCGIGCKDGGTPSLGKPASSAVGAKSEPVTLPDVQMKHSAPQDISTRIRIKYAKTDRLRFLSHLDLMTLFHRAAVRAGLPIAFSRGFNPHPKIAFGPALSVGIESEAEYLDVETDPFIDLLQITKNLNTTLPLGIRILAARVIPKKSPSLSESIVRYRYEVTVPAAYAGDIGRRVGDFLSRTAVLVTKDSRQKDIRPGIESITAARVGNIAELAIILLDKDQLRPRVQDVIQELFAVNADHSVLFGVKRTGMYYSGRGTWQDPLDV